MSIRAALLRAWWGSFPPKELQDARLLTHELFSEMGGSEPHQLATRALSYGEVAVPLLRQEGIERVVIRVSLSAIESSLSSGRFHTYRGLLGIEGRRFNDFHRTVAMNAAKAGVITDEEAFTRCAELYQAIKEVG